MKFHRVRVQDAERDSFAVAGELSGLDLSAWVRTRLRTMARKELKDHGESVPFLDKK